MSSDVLLSIAFNDWKRLLVNFDLRFGCRNHVTGTALWQSEKEQAFPCGLLYYLNSVVGFEGTVPASPHCSF